MNLAKELEEIEKNEKAKKLRQTAHILHPAGGLTEDFVYEPTGSGEYVYRTKEEKKGIVQVEVEFEDEERRRGAHWFLEIEGEPHYFIKKPPKEWLFNMPDKQAVEKWVNGEKQSYPLEKIWNLNGVYLRTFLDFPHAYEFSVTLLFIRQSWLTEILPVVFYLGIKGEFGGGKTVTGEAVTFVCRHGYLTGNLSPPFVARAIQEQKITLMVDELDSVAGTRDSDLNSIFRQGYRRGLRYSRVNPDTLESESYHIFGPKLFTVHSEIEEALQTRTIPIHVRETGKLEFPVVNLDKESFSRLVYTENFLWYMDNILSLRDNEIHVIQGLTNAVDTVDMVDLFLGDLEAESQEKTAENIREKLYSRKKSLLSDGQLSQLCQLTGRNIELMYMCFVLSNMVKAKCDNDILKTFQQKIIEEAERTELGYLGILREVLTSLWKQKHGVAEYTTEDGYVKISNKELYDKYNESLKKELGHGVSPAKFKEFMLEFGFTDSLNRTKLKVPTPGDPEPKSRLCNIFTKRVLRKLGIEPEPKGIRREPTEENIEQPTSNSSTPQNIQAPETPFNEKPGFSSEKKDKQLGLTGTPNEKTQITFDDLKAVYWSDQSYSWHTCCICSYTKLTAWQAEGFKGNKFWICDDCKLEWEKRRNSVD